MGNWTLWDDDSPEPLVEDTEEDLVFRKRGGKYTGPAPMDIVSELTGPDESWWLRLAHSVQQRIKQLANEEILARRAQARGRRATPKPGGPRIDDLPCPKCKMTKGHPCIGLHGRAVDFCHTARRSEWAASRGFDYGSLDNRSRLTDRQVESIVLGEEAGVVPTRGFTGPGGGLTLKVRS
jgi:hypothetical protein